MSKMGSSRILIVDDDPALLAALNGAMQLRMPEVTVETCDAALAAIDKVARMEYDAVVTDIKMPGMDGLALLKRIRTVQPDLPTLLITGHGQHDLAVQALRGGAFDFIQKPIDRDYFVASLSRAIRVRKMDRQLKRQQKSLENHAAELEQAVEARTQQLRDANRRKDEFLAMLAHELRNPLACILSSAELVLLEGENSGSANENCQIIVQQSQQMRRLLDDLLDLSRISRNKIGLRKTKLPLSQVIDPAIRSIRDTIQERKQNLLVSVARDIAEQNVLADTARLQQVIVNLLVNAAKYTEPGGEIRFSAWREDADVLIQVEDSGIGIAPHLLHAIFEPFVQADDTGPSANGGLGIGLTLVRQLVQLHGGSVSAASEGIRKGSRFTVRLPIVADAETTVLPLDSPQGTLPARRVMLVEDQSSLARLMRCLLEKLGQKVVAVASDGPSALEAAARHRPDLIFMDIGLPGMSGYDVARRIREFPQLDHTVLVAMTGYGSPDDQREARLAGFEHHLIKPCSCESIADCLRNASPSHESRHAPPVKG